MTYNEVELDTFLRRDIVEFLDTKYQMQGEQERDFYNEIREALLKHESEIARELLELTIDEYNEVNPNNVYKDIKFNKISSIIELIKRYLEATGEQTKLAEDIRAIDESKEMDKSKPARISAIDFRKVEKQQREFDERAKEYEFKEELAGKIKKLTQELFVSIRKKDLETSVDKYKLLTAYFEQYPANFLEEKKQIYNDILAFYLQIQVMKKDMTESQKKEMDDFNRQIRETEGIEKRFIKIKDIKDLVIDIKKDVKDANFNDAKAKIIELKYLTSKIPDRYKSIKMSLYTKINVLNQRVEFARNIAENQRPV